MDLLDTAWAELDPGGEEVNTLVLVQRGVNEGWLRNALLALRSLEQRLGEASTGHGHGEGGGSGTVLGLDDLVTTELNAVQEGSVADKVGVLALGEEGDDGDTGVSTNDGNGLISRVGLLDLGDEAGCADDIEGGDTEEALGVVDAGLLEDLSNDGDGAVDGVGDDEDVGVGGRLGGGNGQVADNGGVGVEEVVAGHAWLAGNTGGDQDDLGILKGGGEAGWGGLVAGDVGAGVDVGDISGDTCQVESVCFFVGSIGHVMTRETNLGLRGCRRERARRRGG